MILDEKNQPLGEKKFVERFYTDIGEFKHIEIRRFAKKRFWSTTWIPVQGIEEILVDNEGKSVPLELLPIIKGMEHDYGTDKYLLKGVDKFTSFDCAKKNEANIEKIRKIYDLYVSELKGKKRIIEAKINKIEEKYSKSSEGER